MSGSAAGNAPAPRKSGLSGCAIAIIVAAMVGVLGVFLIGILAAIAVPAYQDYVVRARIQSASMRAEALQQTVDAFRESDGRCPGNTEAGLDDPEIVELGYDNDGRPMTSILRLETVEDGRCAIRVEFADASPAIDGKTLQFESADGVWTCSGGTLSDKYRPPHCRGGISSP
jgi:type IV pilus assembly protein PilA